MPLTWAGSYDGASSYRLCTAAEVAAAEALGNNPVGLLLSGRSIADPIFTRSSEIVPAAVRDAATERVDRPGIDDLTTLYGAAGWRADLAVFDTDGSRYQYLDLIKGRLRPSQRPYLYIEREGWSGPRRAVLRGDQVGCTIARNAHTYLEVSVQASIPDGVLEAAAESSIEIRPVTSAEGVAFDVVFDLAWPASALGSTYLAELDGNEDVAPVAHIYGGCTGPSLRVEYDDGTQARLDLPGVGIGIGTYMTVDFASRQVYLGEDPTNSFHSKVDFTTSSWWTLRAGDGITASVNKILFSATEFDSSCVAILNWRDKWVA